MAIAAPSVERPVVRLQALDRITARVSTVDAPVGQEVRFGALAITPHTCLETPPTEPPESVAFLEIDEHEPDGNVGRVFGGWMYASAPAFSAMEHPVYDVWVLSCLSVVSTAAAPVESGATAPGSTAAEPADPGAPGAGPPVPTLKPAP